MAAATQLARGRGRPRSAQLDSRILRVAARQLRERGYDDMSMEQVAAEAGVGKATLYRRYRDKADLATAAVAEIARTRFDEPPPDDTREALVDHLRRLERAMGDGGVGVIAALLAPGTDPALLRLHRERVIARGRARAVAILRRARERGELRAGADLGVAVEMLVGSCLTRRLAGRRTTHWAESVADTLLRGLAR